MAAAVEVDTVQGVIPGDLWFHLDLTNDVLYLRRADTRPLPVYGEETPEGFTLLRTDSGSIAGLTVVNYWRRFGKGDIRLATFDRIRNIVGDWAAKHAR